MCSNFNSHSEVIAKIFEVEYSNISFAQDPPSISHLPYLNP